MSLRDTLLVVLRRWKLSVPALILSIAAAVGAFLAVPPSYTSTMQLLVLTSPVTAGVDEATNPFLNFGSTLVATAGVLQLNMMSPQVVSTLAKQGASAEYEVVVDGSSPAPILVITSTDHNAALTATTVAAVASKLDTYLSDQQKAAGAPQKTWIKTSKVFTSPKPDIVRKNQIRATILALVAMIGFFLVVLFMLEGRAQRKQQYRQAEMDWPTDSPERPNLRTPAAGPAPAFAPAGRDAVPQPWDDVFPVGRTVPQIRPIPPGGDRRPAPTGAPSGNRGPGDAQRPVPMGAPQAPGGWVNQPPRHQGGQNDDRRPAPGGAPRTQGNGQAGPGPQPMRRNPQGAPDGYPNGWQAPQPNGQNGQNGYSQPNGQNGYSQSNGQNGQNGYNQPNGQNGRPAARPNGQNPVPRNGQNPPHPNGQQSGR